MMNIQQLEYIAALDNERHFRRAAEACNISQPTLSMMVRKLEEELDIVIFDRSKQPIVPTRQGEKVLKLARSIIAQTKAMEYLKTESNGEMKGSIELAVIPTLAPYLIPLFINTFLKKYPRVKLRISEMRTEQITSSLKQSKIDAGIMITPAEEKMIREDVLFYEPFWAYSSSEFEKRYVTSDDINTDELWLLEEGHCFHTQMFRLCDLKRKSSRRFEYYAGSIETLKKLVDQQQGITILPELATLHLSAEEKSKLKPFADPVPVREVSLCTHRNYAKKQLLDALKAEILAHIPPHMLEEKERERIDI